MQSLVAAALLVAFLGLAQGQVIYPTMRFKETKAVLAVVGDWGRTGGLASMAAYDTWSAPIGGTPAGPGFCRAQFGSTPQQDEIGAENQVIVAEQMETVCSKAKCAGVLSTGDNFYECGLDDPLRWKTDFEDIYQNDNMTCLKNLMWYTVFGNHDIVATGSVDAQIAYGYKNPTWVAPARYFGSSMVAPVGNGKFIEIGLHFINTNPFVTKYHSSKAGYKYNTVEMQATGIPQAISAQLDWLEWRLKSSTANLDIIIGHHPIVGAADSQYGFAYLNLLTNGNGTSMDDGWPDAEGNPSFQRIFKMIRKYEVAAYINGHDHVLTVGVDPEDPDKYPTKYITTGAGSWDEQADNCGYRREYVKFVSSTNMTGDCKAGSTGNAYAGFTTLVIDATAKTAKLNFYRAPETKASYSTDLTWKKKAAKTIEKPFSTIDPLPYCM